MPSNAHQNWEERLNEIDQLMEAHGALVRFKRAQEHIERFGSELQNIGLIIDALVADAGPGKPPQVQALNSAAIALLSAHLQGFVVDLFKEACDAMLNSRVPDLGVLKKAAPTRGNPNTDNINKLFGTIGMPNILSGISWKRMSNESLRVKLRNFNELRNRVVHGRSEVVSKTQVQNYLNVWKNLSKHLDRKVHDEIQQITSDAPWPRG